jgi:hypothetical protein
MSIFGILAVIFLLAFLVESSVEYLAGEPFNRIPALQPHKWLLMYVACGVGIAGAFVYQFDLLWLLAHYFGVDLVHSPFGIVITGAAIGRGANYLHSLVKRFFVKDNPVTVTASANYFHEIEA